MSRIGKLPIKIPEGVQITLSNHLVKVAGPKGQLEFKIPEEVAVKIGEGQVQCQAAKEKSNLWGLTRTIIANALSGASAGWTKTLELVGVGYRASVEGEELVLTVGFSHLVRFKAPAGISFSVSENKITVSGADKQLVGEIAAQIRRIRPPEPYKGKGIKYQGEFIKRKVGKAAKAIGVGGKA